MIAIPTRVTVSGTASNTSQPINTESINCMYIHGAITGAEARL